MKNKQAPGRTVARIHRLLLQWYKASARPLPWRATRNPYRILVSEVMLQQTQVSRVLEKYPRFLKRYPGLSSLARSTPAGVLRSWRGMGYNNRAIRLRHLAKTVMAMHNGVFPRTIEELQALPGIGRYTANAIACFAFGATVPVVDTNIRRVLARLFPRTAAGDPWDTALRVLPVAHAYEWNQALMDLGSTFCRAVSPLCPDCPLKSVCPSASRVERPARRASRPEPGRRGIPNRIYRGRVVETLRTLKGRKGLSANVLARTVLPTYSPRDRVWFNHLLERLKQDGIISIRGRFISFPK